MIMTIMDLKLVVFTAYLMNCLYYQMILGQHRIVVFFLYLQVNLIPSWPLRSFREVRSSKAGRKSPILGQRPRPQLIQSWNKMDKDLKTGGKGLQFFLHHLTFRFYWRFQARTNDRDLSSLNSEIELLRSQWWFPIDLYLPQHVGVIRVLAGCYSVCVRISSWCPAVFINTYTQAPQYCEVHFCFVFALFIFVIALCLYRWWQGLKPLVYI